MIVLRPNSQCGLKVQGALKRLEREINGAETRTCCGKSIVNVRCFRLALQGSFKHFLSSDVFAAVKLDYATII